MAEVELRNESKNEFVDISTEEYRVYFFSKDHSVVIKEPQYLSVSSSGGHRILSKDGISHYIPSGWYLLEWEAKEGCPHFVK